MAAGSEGARPRSAKRDRRTSIGGAPPMAAGEDTLRTNVSVTFAIRQGLCPPSIADARCRIADDAQEFPPREGILAEFPEHGRRHHAHAGLVHAARRHALVLGLDDDRDALGF